MLVKDGSGITCIRATLRFPSESLDVDAEIREEPSDNRGNYPICLYVDDRHVPISDDKHEIQSCDTNCVVLARPIRNWETKERSDLTVDYELDVEAELKRKYPGRFLVCPKCECAKLRQEDATDAIKLIKHYPNNFEMCSQHDCDGSCRQIR